MKALAGLVAVAVIVAASIVLVRLGNGDFSSAYDLSARFSNVSAGLHDGSQVEEDGVQIGSVRQVTLERGRAVLTLGISSRYRVPDNATATIEPENLFGADQVAISAPGGQSQSARAAAPLPAGGTITHTVVLDELGHLFSSADPLLSKLDTNHLADVIGELSAAYGGQGSQIANSLKEGTALAGLLARTEPAQLAALDGFSGFVAAIKDEGPTFNQLGADANQTLPLFNAHEPQYAALLVDLGDFSERLSALVTDYRPDIDTILNAGDNVIRVLLAQRSDVASLIQGLAEYTYKFAHGASQATLPDGSRFAYFKTFVLWNDVDNFVCSLIAPAKGGLSFLKPLQSALLSGNTMLNCSSELAAFENAQGSGGTVSGGTGSGSGSGAGAGSGSGSGGTSSAGRSAATGLYGALGTPDGHRSSESVGEYLDSLLPASGALP